jgi:hypothetical protein
MMSTRVVISNERQGPTAGANVLGSAAAASSGNAQAKGTRPAAVRNIGGSSGFPKGQARHFTSAHIDSWTEPPSIGRRANRLVGK